MYQALYRKWRPRRFDELVGQEHITDTLRRQVEADRLSHAYLFTGTRGTGKTSCAKILAKAVNCEIPEEGNPCNRCEACLGIDSGSILDVLELDAASNNGVDQVRALREEAVYTPATVRRRVYIVDEVHMLSTAAFNALLKILEEPPSHLLFILATTELHKVPATIKSRCQQFSFKRILTERIAARLQFVAGQEGFALSEQAGLLLARLAEGGLRDALSLLDQCSGTAESLDEAQIFKTLGLAGSRDIAALFCHITAHDCAEALGLVGRLYHEGKDLSALLGELATLLRDLLLRKTAGRSAAALQSGSFEEETLRSLSAQSSGQALFSLLSVLQETRAQLSRSGSARTDVELCILRLAEPSLAQTPIAPQTTSAVQAAAPVARQEQVAAPPAAPPQQAPPLWESAPQSAQAVDAAPPPAQSETPPWEDVVAPAAQVAPSPPERPAAVAPMAPAVPDPIWPAPAAMMSPTATDGGGEDWKRFAAQMRGKLPPSAYAFFGKPSFVQGVFEAKSLRLFVDSDMTKDILSKPDVARSIEAEACQYAGRSLQLHLQVGKAEEAASTPAREAAPVAASEQQASPVAQADPAVQQSAAEEAVPPVAASLEHDKLNDLIKLGGQFGNITIK